jgi:antitoxin component YwqK of YwqJK toxin-antitoxin module
MKHYRSYIPKEAKERVLTTRLTGPQKLKAEYILNGKVVGIRQFDEDEILEFECPLKDGVTHGTLYEITDGIVTFAEHYSDGLAHGMAKQWSNDGELIGTYTMRRGTGVDLWRVKDNWGRGQVYLAEARFVKEGKWHGFEWWLNEDQKTVCDEHHFWENLQHGIQRSWNAQGHLRRGYPRYWVKNVRVTKRKYLRECAGDSDLPPYRDQDNLSDRTFPPGVREHCVKGS